MEGVRRGGRAGEGYSIMLTALGNAQVLSFQLVYQPMLLRDAPRPVAFVSVALERLRLASARKWRAGVFLQKPVDFRQYLGIRTLPVEILLPRAGCPADGFIH